MEKCCFKVTLLHGCFSRFLNCTNDTKLRNAPQLVRETLLISSMLKPEVYKVLSSVIKIWEKKKKIIDKNLK